MLKSARNVDRAVFVGIFADDGRKFRSLYVRENIMSDREYDNALKNAKHMSKTAYSLN
jgi:cysteine synthase B